MRALFPAAHPYHWPTIGEPADLAAATLDDVRGVLHALLPPGQRVAGRCRRRRHGRRCSRMAEELFGPIPAGRARARPCRWPRRPPRRRAGDGGPGRAVAAVPGLAVRRACSRRATPSWTWSSDLVANGRTSRLYGRLIHDRRDCRRAGRRPDVARARRHVPDRRVGGARAYARRTRGRDLRGDRAVRRRRAHRATRSSRGRVQAETAFVFRVRVARRLRRQGRPAERLQHLSPDAGQLPGRPAIATCGATRATLRAARRTSGSAARAAVALAVVPQGTAGPRCRSAERVDRQRP